MVKQVGRNESESAPPQAASKESDLEGDGVGLFLVRRQMES